MTRPISLILLVGLGFGAAACDDTSDGSDGAKHATAASSAAQAKKKGDLSGAVPLDAYNPDAVAEQKAGKAEAKVQGDQIVVSYSSEPALLNDWVDNSAVTNYILSYMMNALLTQDPETFAWKPSLAERWTQEDMLMEILGDEELAIPVEYSKSDQNWKLTRGADNVEKRYKWEVVERAGKYFLLTLKEHRGLVERHGEEYLVKTAQGGELKFPVAKVARVNKGTAFTFFLDPKAKFHDGAPVTSKDVVFSLDTIKCEYVDCANLRGYYQDIKEYVAVDERTVRITYAQQYFKAIEFVSGFYVYPEHVFNEGDLLHKDAKAFGERFNKHAAHNNPIGTGPYKFEAWDKGTSVTLRRNDDFWKPAVKGWVDRIIFKFVQDPGTALLKLKADEIDFIDSITAEQWMTETGEKDFLAKYIKADYYTGGFGYIGWNMRRPPFDDKRVRRAMAHGAINREEYLKQVMHDMGVIVTGSQYFRGPAYNHDVKAWDYNPEKAAQILRLAGWVDHDSDGIIDKGGKAFKFEYLLPSGNPVGMQQAAIIKENLKRLGIEMDIRQLEWATFLKQIDERQYDACRLGWATPIESDPYQIWHSSQTENQGSNHVGFVHARADEIITLAREELDDEKRWKLYYELHEIQHDEQPYLFMHAGPNRAVYSRRYRGIKHYAPRPGYDLGEWFVPQRLQRKR